MSVTKLTSLSSWVNLVKEHHSLDLSGYTHVIHNTEWDESEKKSRPQLNLTTCQQIYCVVLLQWLTGSWIETTA